MDDAHGFGTIGPSGRGTVAARGLDDDRIIQTISLGTSLGMQGGAIVWSRSMIKAIYDSAPAFIGNTAPLLPIASGITAAVKLLAGNPGRVERLQSNARLIHALLPQAEHIFHDLESPVLVIYPRDVASARRLRSMLQRAGIFPSWITYLNSPPQGIFRFALSSSHTARDVRQLAAVIVEWEKGQA